MPLMTYNGVAFPFQRTVRSDDRVVYTDDGVDALHVERAITVEATLTPDIPGLGILQGETWAHFVNRLRNALEQPRKDLLIAWGYGVYLSVTKYDDRKNGPLPEGVSIREFAGQDACVLTFTVRCWTPVCEDRSRNPRWVSHRWTERLAIDPKTWAKTWTRTGTLHVHPDPGLAGNADVFRGIVTPPIRQGYLRVKPPEYELSSDGLALRYTVADEEQYAMPPTGAVSADGNCSVAVNLGLYMHAEVTVRLSGSLQTDKYRLLEMAAVIAMQKLEDVGVTRIKGIPQLLNGAMRTQLYRNEVEVYLRAKLAPPSNDKTPKWVDDTAGIALGLLDQWASGGIISGLVSLFGKEEKPKAGDKPPTDQKAKWVPKGATPPKGLARKPWGYDSRSPDPGEGGVGLELLAAALQDPCLVPTSAPYVGGLGQVVTDPAGTYAGSAPPKKTAETRTLKGGTAFPDNPGGLGGTLPVTGGVNPDNFRTPSLAAVDTPDGFDFPDPVFSVVSPAIIDRDADSPPTASALHTDYRIRQRVVEDEGLVGHTEMRKYGLTRFIPVRARSVMLVAEWTAERVGSPPVVPPKDFGDPNFVYLGREYDPGTWETDETGVTSTFRVSGSYRYGVVDPSKAEVGMSIAPWVAELMGRAAAPILGPDAPPAYDADTGKPATMDDLRAWRDKGGDSSRPPTEESGS